MIQRLTEEFGQSARNVDALINLHLDGNTVPFIARYRKEQTGGMDEIMIRAILERYEYLVNLAKRKEEVIAAIDERGKLTDELKKAIMKAETLKEVEDLYAPYKSKKKTKADLAREAGIEPLANYIMASEDLSALADEAAKYLCEAAPDADTAITMARDIITETLGHDIDIKNRLRELYVNEAVLESRKGADVTGRTAYEAYYEFAEPVKNARPHRVMAIFRGEREKVLKVKLVIDEDICLNAAAAIAQNKGMKLNDVVKKCVNRAYKTMLSTSIELELRGELKDAGEERAISVFADNLKSLLMTPPVNGRRILGLDPAYRTGCKFAVVDETGKLLDYGVMYPTPPQSDYAGSRKKVAEMVKKHQVNAIAIGNGTASRETGEFVAKVIDDEQLSLGFTIVSEAGASVYSASEVAARQFPELDVTIRGAISIARRVIDPLAELVKIEPRSIGVGMYQHDVNKKRLEETLGGVVEDVVNNVGVDLNTASASLLQYIAGLNYSLAERIVRFREDAGRFKNREELLNVAGIGEQVYRQCAGFLKIFGGAEPLDSLFIHPESYQAVYAMLERLKLTPDKAQMVRLAAKGQNMKKLGEEYGLGEFTMKDILDSLEKPDRDVRDDVDPVIFRQDVVDMEALKEGMILEGKVSNVVDFGCFVDIGLKNDGLVHISQIADRYVKHPSEVVSVGQKVKVRIVEMDKERGRIGLSMKQLSNLEV